MTSSSTSARPRGCADRVGSYFSSRLLAPKVAALVARIARIEVTVVNSESEALLLESNLIKAHRPRYNIILRDDKSFPYILCPARTISAAGVLSRAASARQPPVTAVSERLGGQGSAAAPAEGVSHSQLPRSFFANRTRPCLQYQIGRCSAPCVGLIDRDSYARDLEGAIGVLEGRNATWWRRCSGAWKRRPARCNSKMRRGCAISCGELQEIRAQQIANAQRRRYRRGGDRR